MKVFKFQKTSMKFCHICLLMRIKNAGTLARNPRRIRRRQIDDADISTAAAVDQRAVNCLEEAVRSFIAMQSRCRSSCAEVTFRRSLPVFRVVRLSSVYCFQTRITVELFRCTQAPVA
ncbi:UNVERIFIED_CONTAM: hypothetical protein NCL1_23179 [Trichonephila clavipes]